jgi:hypothetical protein
MKQAGSPKIPRAVLAHGRAPIATPGGASGHNSLRPISSSCLSKRTYPRLDLYVLKLSSWLIVSRSLSEAAVSVLRRRVQTC